MKATEEKTERNQLFYKWFTEDDMSSGEIMVKHMAMTGEQLSRQRVLEIINSQRKKLHSK